MRTTLKSSQAFWRIGQKLGASDSHISPKIIVHDTQAPQTPQKAVASKCAFKRSRLRLEVARSRAERVGRAGDWAFEAWPQKCVSPARERGTDVTTVTSGAAGEMQMQITRRHRQAWLPSLTDIVVTPAGGRRRECRRQQYTGSPQWQRKWQRKWQR